MSFLAVFIASLKDQGLIFKAFFTGHVIHPLIAALKITLDAARTFNQGVEAGEFYGSGVVRFGSGFSKFAGVAVFANGVGETVNLV